MCSRPVGRIPLKTRLFFPSAAVATLVSQAHYFSRPSYRRHSEWSRPTFSSAFAPAKASACGCEESLFDFCQTPHFCTKLFLFFVAQLLWLCAWWRSNSSTASFLCKSQGGRMLRLIQANLASTGQFHLGNRTPSRFLNL